MAGIISPMELLKIRMQVQGSLNSPKKYSGIIECLAKTIKHEGGPKSLYRGYTATIFRDAPSYAAYFGTYQYLKDLSESPTVIHQLLAGGIAGIAAWLPAYPQDVIKSQMQLNSDCRLGFLQASKSLYKRDGFPGFFKGITPTLARAFPANAACFYAFELSRHFLQS